SEEVQQRKETEQTIFTTDKTIDDLKDKVSDDEKEKANNAKEELKKALESDNIDEIKAKKEALEEQVQQLSVKLYEQMAEQQQGAQGQEGQGNADDDVVDADYKEVDEDEEDKK